MEVVTSLITSLKIVTAFFIIRIKDEKRTDRKVLA